MKHTIDGFRDSLWATTAVPVPPTRPFSGNSSTDVAVIGAGLTGLSAALTLAEQGVEVTVLEASVVGYGASGRSGGQVNLGLNAGPSELLQQFGKSQGERLIELVLQTPNVLFDLVSRHDMNCDPVQNGWVQAAVSKRIWEVQQRMAEDYNQHGSVLQVIDAHGLSELSGAQGYAGGLFCRVAGSVQPLSYTRELARVAMQFGAKVHTDSAVTGIDRQAGSWVLKTADGELRARTVLLCTNGYTPDDLGAPLDNLSRTIVPVRSLLAATKPLSWEQRKQVMPNQVTFVDKRRLILYARYDRDGRLCIGFRAPMRDRFSLSDFNEVKQRALSVFPQLDGVRWDYHWGGRVAVTRSSLPFLHEVAPGLLAGMGFNGRGVGMGTMMGRELARQAMRPGYSGAAFPVTRPRQFNLHSFHRAGVSCMVKWYALRDYLDSIG